MKKKEEEEERRTASNPQEKQTVASLSFGVGETNCSQGILQNSVSKYVPASIMAMLPSISQELLCNELIGTGKLVWGIRLDLLLGFS